MYLSLSLYSYLSLSLSFFGQFMSSHHSAQMSQRSPVSGVALLRCSPNVFVFVIVIVFVFVFVFVIVFCWVRSCLLITLIKCLKGHQSLGSLFQGALLMYLSLSLSLSFYLSLSLSFVGSGHVFSSLWSNVSKVTSLWDRSFKVLSECICLCQCHCLCLCLCHCLFFVRSCLLITLIKCLKGHKSLGSLCSVVKTLIVSGARPSKGPRDKVTYWAVLDS